MFAPQKSTQSNTTKIPSPTLLHRSASLRIRGEVIPRCRATNPQQKHYNPGSGGGGGGGGALMEAAKSRPIKTPAGASPRVPQSPARNRSLVSERVVQGVRVIWWGESIDLVWCGSVRGMIVGLRLCKSPFLMKRNRFCCGLVSNVT